jgi:hypothetical protein
MLRNVVSKRNVMSISLVLLALAAVALAPMPRPAQADDGVPFKGTLTVQFVVSQSCAPGNMNCSTCIGNSGLYVEAQGISDTSLGPLFVEVLKCFNPSGGLFGTYAGTLTTTAPNGKDSLTWAYSGQNDNAGDFYGFGPFSGKLTITGGTGKFEDAHGSANFTAASGPSTAVGPSPFNPPVTFVGMAFYSVQGNLGLRDND